MHAFIKFDFNPLGNQIQETDHAACHIYGWDHKNPIDRLRNNR